MADQVETILLDEIVFYENNSEWYWTFLSEITDSFLSEFLVIRFIIFGSFWRLHLATSCDEKTGWVGNLCSAAGITVPNS